jgi:hypothetical protein
MQFVEFNHKDWCIVGFGYFFFLCYETSKRLENQVRIAMNMPSGADNHPELLVSAWPWGIMAPRSLDWFCWENLHRKAYVCSIEYRRFL